MPECQGWRLFLVCLALAWTGRGWAETPPGGKKPETEKKREAPTELPPPRRAHALEAVTTPEAKIAVRHLERTESGWSVAETEHFRLYHVQTRAQAEKEAVAAERAEAAARRRWFGASCPCWDRRCEVFIYPTADDYADATGAPTHSPGHSEIRADGSRVSLRRIHLHADEPGMLEAILPHEVTHAVLAGHFGDYQVPRWADEGMAVLNEPRDRIERHLKGLPRLRDEGRLFSARQLIALKDYPEPRRIAAFYAQSVSLTEFLAKEKSPVTVAKFVRDGLRDGYETALQRYYGWDFTELDRHWRKYAFHK